MRTITVTNLKGGVGKSTTSVNLAAAIGETGRRVLVVDLDPQAAATTSFGISDDTDGLYGAFKGNGPLMPIIRETGAPGVWIIPASPALSGAELELGRMRVGADRVLSLKLAALPTEWDYILIDTPPSESYLMTNALIAASEVLIPIEAATLSLAGLSIILQIVEEVRQNGRHALTITGILPCRVDARTRHAREVIESIREAFPNMLLTTWIRENTKLKEAPSFGVPITLYDTNSAGAADYRALATEITAQPRG